MHNGLTGAQVVPILITFPIGRGLARLTPQWRVLGAQLNPGPFTIKEHVRATALPPRYAYTE